MIVSLVCMLGIYFGITKHDTVTNLLVPKRIEKILMDIITDKNISLTYKGNRLKVDYVYVGEGNYAILLKDENDKSLDFIINDVGTFQIVDERFLDIAVTDVYHDEQVYLKITVDRVDWYFKKIKHFII